MFCYFCNIEILDVDEAIDAGWIPSFWANEDREILYPVCPGCLDKYLVYVDPEYVLKIEEV
jgi:hypothetical protein